MPKARRTQRDPRDSVSAVQVETDDTRAVDALCSERERFALRTCDDMPDANTSFEYSLGVSFDYL